VTSDPGPGSNGFPLPPSYGPPSYGPVSPYGPGPYGPPAVYNPYPYGQVQPVQLGMLAAAADRERTLDVLKAAFGEGRLNKEEFDSRSARVMAARTYADLNAIVADLPAGPGGLMPYHVGAYQPARPVAPTNGLAIGSMVCGFAGIVTFGFAAIPAVILGHIARSQIKQTGEPGDGMAVTGLVLGYMGLLGLLFMILIIAGHS
jgi:hypothetical protein